MVVGASAALCLGLGGMGDASFKRAELAAAGFPVAARSEQRTYRVDKGRTKWEDAELAAEANGGRRGRHEGRREEGGGEGRLPLPPVLRQLLQHVTAIGVERIVLCQSARVEKSYWNSLAL